MNPIVAFRNRLRQININALCTTKSQFPARNLAMVGDLCSRLVTLSYGNIAAYHYGSIGSVLEQAGQTIGVNELHIAARARSQGLLLVSNNLREFERVPGLLLENWLA